MSKVSLTLGESKTTDDLTKEGKGATDTTWATTAPSTWETTPPSTWARFVARLTLGESKTTDDLSLETK